MSPSRRTALWLCGLCLVAGGILRWIPCFNDFWLDEIWSYWRVRELHSALGVFTEFRDWTNHHLVSLCLYALGPRAEWPLYRMPSFVAGTASVAVAARLGWRRGRLEAVFAAALTGFSFALIHYSSEARGYALAVCFALLAYALLESELERPRAWRAAAFAVAVLLGLLSHLTFLFFYAGACMWSAWRLSRRAHGPTALALGLARLHLAPLAGLTLLYAVNLRGAAWAGGPPTTLAQVVARTTGYFLGLPVTPGWALPNAALVLCVIVSGSWLLARERDDRVLLFATTLAAPLLVIAAVRPDVVAVRYLLVPGAFFLLLASMLLARMAGAGGVARAASLALLAAFLAGNAVHTWAFLERGRGGYREALLFMAEHTAGSRIDVGSDHDTRNRIVLAFYRSQLPAGRTLVYHRRDRWPAGGPEWLVVHRLLRPEVPRAFFVASNGLPYRLAAEFDYGAISGFYWAVYHRAGSLEASPPARRSGPGTSAPASTSASTTTTGKARAPALTR